MCESVLGKLRADNSPKGSKLGESIAGSLVAIVAPELRGT
jgi:hypothetical protein